MQTRLRSLTHHGEKMLNVSFFSEADEIGARQSAQEGMHLAALWSRQCLWCRFLSLSNFGARERVVLPNIEAACAIAMQI
jgi:hypothetical protein